MEFEVKTILNRKEVLDYQRVTGKTVQKGKMMFLRTCLVGIGLVGLTVCSMGMAQGGINLTSVMGLALSTAAFVLGARWYQYLGWKNSRSMPESFEENFYFTGEGVVAKSANEQVVHTYKDFKALAETEEYYCVFLNSQAGYILPKNGFQRGDPTQFGTFIQEKTGKELPFVKI